MDLRAIDVFLVRAALALLMLLALIGGVLAWQGSAIASGAAEQIVGHSAQPKGSVYPPTPFLPMQSTAEIAALGGRAEGISCSLPGFAESFFADAPADSTQTAPTASVNLQFRQACLRHDYCYRHGAATYGYTQFDCDNFLAEDAARLCMKIMRYDERVSGSQKGIDWCQTRARKVLLGVMLGGAAAFREQLPNHRYQVQDEKSYDLQSEVSTRLEYDPYPNVKSDREQLSLRLAETVTHCEHGPALITYRRQIGGQAVSYRCVRYDNVGEQLLRLESPKQLPLFVSEFGRLPSAPWLSSTTSSNPTLTSLKTKKELDKKTNYTLVQWCRDYDSNGSTTGGFFSESVLGGPEHIANEEIDFLQCNLYEDALTPKVKENTSRKKKVAIEPDTTAYFPLPVTPAFNVEALFLNTTLENGSMECHAWAVPNNMLSAKINSKTNDVKITKRSDVKKFPNFHTPVLRDSNSSQGQNVDCYRWFTNAPQFVSLPNNNTMNILFSRRGEADGAGYADTLDVMMRDYDGSGFGADTVYARLPMTEMQEPFIALPHQNGAALLSVSRDDLDNKGYLATWLGIRLVGALILALVVYFMARADFGIQTRRPVVSAFAHSNEFLGTANDTNAEKTILIQHLWSRYRGGLGFAALALTVCLVWIGISATKRDDIVRTTKLGTSVTFTLWPITQDSRPINIPWDQLSPTGQFPVRYMQNRISLVKDGDGGHYLLAPRIASVTSGCTVKVELAVVHLGKDAEYAFGTYLRAINWVSKRNRLQ